MLKVLTRDLVKSHGRSVEKEGFDVHGGFNLLASLDKPSLSLESWDRQYLETEQFGDSNKR